jgi:hypothetical protein
LKYNFLQCDMFYAFFLGSVNKSCSYREGTQGNAKNGYGRLGVGGTSYFRWKTKNKNVKKKLSLSETTFLFFSIFLFFTLNKYGMRKVLINFPFWKQVFCNVPLFTNAPRIQLYSCIAVVTLILPLELKPLTPVLKFCNKFNGGGITVNKNGKLSFSFHF